MVVGAAHIGNVAWGTTVAMDGSTGQLWIEPDAQTIAQLEKSKQIQLGSCDARPKPRARCRVSLWTARGLKCSRMPATAEDAIVAANNARRWYRATAN